MENLETFHAEDFLLCFSVFVPISFHRKRQPFSLSLLLTHSLFRYCVSQSLCTLYNLTDCAYANMQFRFIFRGFYFKQIVKSEKRKKVESPHYWVYMVFELLCLHHHIIITCVCVCVCLCFFVHSLSELLFLSNALPQKGNPKCNRAFFKAQPKHPCIVERIYLISTECTSLSLAPMICSESFWLCTFTGFYDMFTHCKHKNADK